MNSIIHHPDKLETLLRSGLQVDALFMLYPTQAHPIDSSTNYLTKDLNDLYPVRHHRAAQFTEVDQSFLCLKYASFARPTHPPGHHKKWYNFEATACAATWLVPCCINAMT